MLSVTHSVGRSLEVRRAGLFALAGLFLLVGAANGGLAVLGYDHTFNEWVALTLELGRLAALLGVAGLSVALTRAAGRLGRLCQGVTTLAIGFTVALIAVAALRAAGVPTTPLPAIGLLTFVLSVTTFALCGSVILLTGRTNGLTGWLLLANSGALLVVFFGRLVVPLWLVATVVPAVQVLLYLAIGYQLRLGGSPLGLQTPVTDSTS